MANLIFEKKLLRYSFKIFDEEPDFEKILIKQVHGDIIIKDSQVLNINIEADGIFTHELNTPLAIRTADCLPIVVIGELGVALLHAGWKGIHQKIVLNKILKSIQPKLFYIGPHIQFEDFVVQEEFKTNFPNSENFLKSGGKCRFNLKAEVFGQIKSIFPNATIQSSELSTVVQPEFHSHRRNATLKRNWNILSRCNSSAII